MSKIYFFIPYKTYIVQNLLKILLFKFLPLILIFSFQIEPSFGQGPKKIGIAVVLDNSGSMSGTQCEYVNYSLNLLTALLTDSDYELYLVQQRDIDEYKNITLPGWAPRFIEQYIIDSRYCDCKDGGIYPQSIVTAISSVNKIDFNEKWLIILSDGEAGGIVGSELENLKLFSNNGGKILYVNTDNIGNEGNTLFEFLGRNILPSQLETLETNSDEGVLLKKMDYISRLMLASDSIPISIIKENDKITLSSPLPLKSIIVLEQGGNSVSMSKLISASVNEKVSLLHKKPLTVTTTNLKAFVQRVTGNGAMVIPAGKIELGFESNINSHEITIISQPMVELIVTAQGNFWDTNGNVYRLCSDSVKVLIKVVTTEDGINWHIVNPDILKNIEVYIEYLSQKKQLTLVDSIFYCNVFMEKPSFPVIARARYKGLFNLKKNALYLNRVKCLRGKLIQKDSAKLRIDEIKQPYFRGFNFIPKLILEGIERDVSKDEFEDLELNSIKSDGIKINITKNEDQSWNVKPDFSLICFCFFKNGKYSVELEMKSKNGSILPVKYNLIIDISDQGYSLWNNCWKLILLCILIGLFLWYFSRIFNNNISSPSGGKRF